MLVSVAERLEAVTRIFVDLLALQQDRDTRPKERSMARFLPYRNWLGIWLCSDRISAKTVTSLLTLLTLLYVALIKFFLLIGISIFNLSVGTVSNVQVLFIF